MLSAGSYRDRMPPNGWMASRYGTFQCPIIIQSADAVGSAIIANVTCCCRYTYLIGVRIEASGAENDNALHLAGCNHILVRQVQVVGTGDVYAYTTPKEALKANQCQYVYIEDSDLSGGWDNALNCVAVQYGHVTNNRIHRALEWCICLKGGSASLRIEGNEIYDSGVGGFVAGQGTGFEWMVSPWLHYEAYDLKFINNIIRDIEGPSGIGVNGGYNILLAYNTLYRVGRTDHTMEFVHGLRGCDGENTAACAANLKAGGWGTVRTGWENQQPIPSRNVFVYNNIVYNPPGYQSQWQQFAFAPPQTPASDSNIPSPSRADTNLQIKGNIIWNGPPGLPLSGDYIPATPTCNADQLVRENAINTLQPQLIDPAQGNFRPVPAGNVFTSAVFPLPRFPGGDRPQPPLAPEGDLSNTVLYDYDGIPRTSPSPPGAFTTAAAPVASSPAVCAQNANSLDFFAKGTDNALWWKHWDGHYWSSWTSLGGYVTADPAAVSRSPGKITVFVRGGSGSLWSKSTTDGGTTWNPWNEIGGQLLDGTGPTAYAWGDGRIGWFVTGTSHALWHMWDDSSGRHGWQSLGGYLTASPGATSPSNGVIDVFARGSSGGLWQMEYANNAWGGWTPLSGQLASNTGPAATSWGSGRLDIVVTGTSGALWHRSYASGAWSDWQSLGGYTTSSPAATSRAASTIDIFVRGGSGAFWQLTYNNGWSGWTSIGGL